MRRRPRRPWWEDPPPPPPGSIIGAAACVATGAIWLLAAVMIPPVAVVLAPMGMAWLLAGVGVAGGRRVPAFIAELVGSVFCVWWIAILFNALSEGARGPLVAWILWTIPLLTNAIAAVASARVAHPALRRG